MTTDDLASISEALRGMAESVRAQIGREGDPHLCLGMAEMHLDLAARACERAHSHIEAHGSGQGYPPLIASRFTVGRTTRSADGGNQGGPARSDE